MKTTFGIVALGVASVSALSSTCTSTIESLILSTTSHSECINLSGLIPLATLSSTASIVPSINSWLTGLCLDQTASEAAVCTTSVVEGLAGNITTGCASDLEGLGLSAGTVAQLPALAGQYYSVVVEAACTKSSNTLCVTTELQTLQSSTGANLTTSNILSTALAALTNTTLDAQLCNTCAQAIYAVVRPALNSTEVSVADSEFDAVCGAGFAVTTTPAGIVIATGTLATANPSSTSPTSGSGALSLSNSRSAACVLAVLASVVVGGLLGFA